MDTSASTDRFEFTPQQLQVLQNQGGEPLHVSVNATRKVYLVIEEGVIPTLDEDYVRHGLAHAASQAERGEVADWSPEEIKAAGREWLSRQG